MLDLVTQWVSHYGYLLVALFLFVEAAGVPVPGETALVTAAALAGRGTMSLIGVILAGCVGTIAGGHLGYWIGARGGTALVRRHGKWIGMSEERLAKTHRFFEQHGAKTVLLGRFVAFIRSVVGIFAGVSGMSPPVFATYNALGGAGWVVGFSALGFLFGRNLPRLVHYIGRVSLLVAIFIAVIAGAVFLWRWFAKYGADIVTLLDRTFERERAAPAVSELHAHHPLAWRVRFGGFAKGRYLVVHLLVGFGISLAVIGVFASITEGLIDSSPLTRFDVIVADRLRQTLGPEAIHIFQILSSAGGRGAMTLLLGAGVVFYALRRDGITLFGWCAAFIGGSLLDATLRFVVRRSELPFADLVLLGWGSGLASGHVLGVLVGFGMLAYLICRLIRNPAGRTAVIVVATICVAAITVSRLYLGQHYVSDASAGMAAGLVWLTTCVSGIEIARRRHF